MKNQRFDLAVATSVRSPLLCPLPLTAIRFLMILPPKSVRLSRRQLIHLLIHRSFAALLRIGVELSFRLLASILRSGVF